MSDFRHLSPYPALLGLALLATACTGAGDTDPERTGSQSSFDAIGPGETIRALGTEPFWAVTVTGGVARYSDPETPDGRPVEVRRFAGNSGLGFSGTLDGASFDLLVTAGTCSDGMSDRRYPFTATLRLGDRTVEGCASTDRARPQPDDGTRP